jgi:3-hydroxybutyryl-CoA dehydrogenase
MTVTRERLAVLGTGTMGHSIALAAALAGCPVNVWGTDEADIRRGQTGIEEKLRVLQRHEVIDTQGAADIRSRISFDGSLETCVSEATFIIEAIPEILALKQEMFHKLETLCGPDVVFASNTSGLRPTAIAALTTHPERTVVTHFWNPAHLIPLVEVVRGEKTSDDTVRRSLELLRTLRKKPILVQKETLGFIGNRLQYALFREAQYLLEQGVASIEEIDDAVRYSIGRRLTVTGPFMSADMGGLDVFDAISAYLFPDLSTDQASLTTMRRLVDEGKYGQKNGHGFYQWTPEFSQKMNDERETELIQWLKKDWGI